jgi:hypothetical protein
MVAGDLECEYKETFGIGFLIPTHSTFLIQVPEWIHDVAY